MKALFLVTYDISSDKIRTKVAHKLTYFGLSRIQYSVFIGPLSITLLPQLKNWLKGIEVDLATGNSILIFPITHNSLQKRIIFGDATYDWQHLLGLRHTLYLD